MDSEALPEHLRVRLSKKMTGLLRHYGPRYGLKLDPEGWTTLHELVEALHRIPGYQWVTTRHVLEVVRRDEKGRYELRGDRIRARYGHSLKINIKYREAGPGEAPPKLYHGTTRRNLPSILEKGLLPMKRQYVHLTRTMEDAVETGRRHGGDVVVLVVDTRCLQDKGITLYKASDRIYLARHVPPECIETTSALEP